MTLQVTTTSDAEGRFRDDADAAADELITRMDIPLKEKQRIELKSFLKRKIYEWPAPDTKAILAAVKP